MAATNDNWKQPKIVNPNGAVPRIIEGAEAAGQSYKRGAAVYYNAGAVTAVPTGAIDAGLASDQIAGFAMKEASGTTATDAPVMIPDVNSEMIVLVSSSGTAETANTTAVIGGQYGGYVDTDYVLSLDSAETTEVIFQVIGFVRDQDSAVTQYAKVIPLAGAWSFIPADSSADDVT